VGNSKKVGKMHVSRKAILGFVAAAAVLATANIAAAQAPAWAVGTWRGTLDSYRGDPGGPQRVMVVEPSGQCKWDYANKAANPASAKSCSFGADSMELLTGGFSTVKLKHSNGKLRGQFTTSAGGKTFTLTLSK
jgi:hypothetical protein